MPAISLYLKAAHMLIRGQMQYRTSFWLQTVSMVVMTGGELVATLLLFERFTALGQWSRDEILFYFGLMQVTFAQIELFGRGFSSFGQLVRSGQFDRILLRPQSTVAGVLGSQFDPRRLGSLLIGLASLILGSVRAQIVWTPDKLLCLILAVAGGGCLFLGLFMLEATLCFWSVQSIEIVNVVTYGGRTACQYPIDIYPKNFRWLFLYIAPLALTTHLPASWILGKTLFGWPSWLAYLSPLAGGLVLALMLVFWHFGVRHYKSTGS